MEFVFELLFFVGLVVGVVFDQVEAFGEVPGLAGVEVGVLVDKVDGQVPLPLVAKGPCVVADALDFDRAVGAVGVAEDYIGNLVADKELMKGLTAQKGVERGKLLMPHGKAAVGDKVHGQDQPVPVQGLQLAFQDF